MGGGSENRYTSSYNINCYDPGRDMWNSINTDYRDFAMTTLDNKLVIAGGHAKRGGKKTKRIQTLNATDNQLMDHSNLTMKKARSHATAAGYQGILIVTGGKGKGNLTLSCTEVLYSKDGKLYECRNQHRPCYSPKSVIVDNILYVLGGFDEHNNASNAVYTAPLDTVLTPGLEWDNYSDQTPFYASAPVSVNGTHLLIVGGYHRVDTHLLMVGGYNRVEQKHIYTSNIHKFNYMWEVIGDIPSARSNSAAVCTADNRLIVIGGYDDKSEITNTVWIGSFAREPQS